MRFYTLLALLFYSMGYHAVATSIDHRYIFTNITDSIIAMPDSLNKEIATPDSLQHNTTEQKNKWKYFQVQERSPKDAYRFKALYKSMLREDGNNKHLAYDYWKTAFNSTENRGIDMYINGLEIILSRIKTDTLNSRYDKISEHRDEIMELYDIAALNVDKLNAQIDKTKSKDTLSVAKLRSTQLNFYRQLTAWDSIYNSNTKLNLSQWTNKFHNEDSVHANYIYSKYMDILHSSDINIDIDDFLYIAMVIGTKAKYETNINEDSILSHIERDNELATKRMEDILYDPDDPFKMYSNQKYLEMLQAMEWAEGQSIKDPVKYLGWLREKHENAPTKNERNKILTRSLQEINRLRNVDPYKIDTKNSGHYLRLLIGIRNNKDKITYSYETEKRILYVSERLGKNNRIHFDKSLEELAKYFPKEVENDSTLDNKYKYQIYSSKVYEYIKKIDRDSKEERKEINTEIAISYVDKMKMIKPDDLYASYLEYYVYYQGGEKVRNDIINNGKNSDLPGKEYAYYYVLAELFKEIKQKTDNENLVKECNKRIKECQKNMPEYISELFMQGLLYQNDKIKPGIKIRLDFSPYSNTIYETVTK